MESKIRQELNRWKWILNRVEIIKVMVLPQFFIFIPNISVEIPHQFLICTNKTDICFIYLFSISFSFSNLSMKSHLSSFHIYLFCKCFKIFELIIFRLKMQVKQCITKTTWHNEGLTQYGIIKRELRRVSWVLGECIETTR